MEHNFNIHKISNHNYVVLANINEKAEEIVFQGINYNECLEYIARYVKPEISYFIIKDFPSMCKHNMSAEQRANRPERFTIEYRNTIDEAIKVFDLFSDSIPSDNVINKENGEIVPEVALGVCVNGRDCCDVIYNSNYGITLSADFIHFTRNDTRDEFKLGNIRDFICDMKKFQQTHMINRIEFLGKRGEDHRYGAVLNGFFDELPTLRNYDNYGDINGSGSSNRPKIKGR